MRTRAPRALPNSDPEPEPLEALVIDLWRAVHESDRFASALLAEAFRERRLRAPRARAFVADTLYAMLRAERTIDEALRLGRAEGRASSLAAGRAEAPADEGPGTEPSTWERLLAARVLAGWLKPELAARRCAGIDWDAVAGVDAWIDSLSDPVARVAIAGSLPGFVAERLVEERADAALPLARALRGRPPVTLRANALATTRDALADALREEGVETRPGRLAGAALQVVGGANVFSLDAFRRGLFEMQDEGSQLVAELVAPPPRGLVVDFCAGAGGKTLAIAAALGGRGRVLAADPTPARVDELRRRARRAGASNVRAVVLEADAERPLPEALAAVVGRADRVLLDAPCTGLGSLRRNPEARLRLDPGEFTRLPHLQREIAERALPLLAPGGRLIYATCTLLRAENEAIVEALLEAHPELELVAPKEIWGRERAQPLTGEDERFLELTPDRHDTDGFFAAILRRRR
ncbi:MAG TPA: hypothetical protein PLW10_04425 [Myxococcota bacterium]|nr:hypothetical protein [Myxococcota bacterium]